MKRRYANKVDSLDGFLAHGDSVSTKSIALLREKTCGPTFLPGPAGDVECLAYLCAIDDVTSQIKDWAQQTCKQLIRDYQNTGLFAATSSLSIQKEALSDIVKKGEFASLIYDRVEKSFGRNVNTAVSSWPSLNRNLSTLDESFSEARKRIQLLEQENLLFAFQKNKLNSDLLAHYGSALGSSNREQAGMEEDRTIEATYSETGLTVKAGPKV